MEGAERGAWPVADASRWASVGKWVCGGRRGGAPARDLGAPGSWLPSSALRWLCRAP